MALRKIKVRRHNTYALQASLHGINLPMMKAQEEKEKDPPLKAVDDDKVMALLNAALKAKAQERTKNGTK